MARRGFADRADDTGLALCDEVQAIVLENNVTDFILSQAKVSLKSVSFDELMGQS